MNEIILASGNLAAVTAPRFILGPSCGIQSMTEEFKQRAESNREGRYLAQWQIFAEADNWGDTKRSIERRISEIINRKNIFTPASDLENYLQVTVYGLDQDPRMIRLPEQKVEMVSRTYRQREWTRDYISRSFVGKFIGNTYTMDWKERVDIGTRGISTADLYQKLPKFYERIFGSSVNPGDIERLVLPTSDERRLVRIFREATTEKDLPAILSLLDYPGAQPRSASIISSDWDLYQEEYEGISYTDCYTKLDGAVGETWPVNHVFRDWAVEHSRPLGTIADFIKAGLVDWPAYERSEHPVRDAFMLAGCLLTKRGRAEQAENRAFQRQVRDLRSAVTSPLTLT